MSSTQFINRFSDATGTTQFDEHTIAIYLGVIGAIVIISGLLSGFIDRGPISEVLVFVALGVAIGPWGFGVVDFKIDSPAIETVGTITLAMVFFTDAIKINTSQLRQNWIMPSLALGPGAILTMLFIGLGAKFAFDLSWSLVFLIAAVLASTDAVLLRDVLDDRRVPRSVRNTLSIEAGANDVIILPVLLVLAAIASGNDKSGKDWGEFLFDLYILGPLAGVVIAYIATKSMSIIRTRVKVRDDYQSLYSIGVAFLAYATAQALGGSGLLAAFAAGIVISVIDVELCDCFLEYGETTAEMAMLLTFVFLGSALVDSAYNSLTWTTALFALFVLFFARPVAFFITLARSKASTTGKIMLAWFGPRGLNSLLLLILAIAVGIPQGERIFGIVSVVVMASIIIHGSSATPLISWYSRKQRTSSLPEEIAVEASVLLGVSDLPKEDPVILRLSPAELNKKMIGGEAVTVVDVRRQIAVDRDPRLIAGSVHFSLDELLDHLDEMPRDHLIVFSCTCPKEESSLRAAELLVREGYRQVGVLVGGYTAWVEGGYPLDEERIAA
jgi:NhaP-type Na+/H+ or K+/H+ antiporter